MKRKRRNIKIKGNFIGGHVKRLVLLWKKEQMKIFFTKMYELERDRRKKCKRVYAVFLIEIKKMFNILITIIKISTFGILQIFFLHNRPFELFLYWHLLMPSHDQKLIQVSFLANFFIFYYFQQGFFLLTFYFVYKKKMKCEFVIFFWRT